MKSVPLVAVPIELKRATGQISVARVPAAQNSVERVDSVQGRYSVEHQRSWLAAIAVVQQTGGQEQEP